jgi:glucose-6-phosphate 1-dehydrogenase
MELKDNTIIVVLGASGDLAKKKTVRKEATARENTRLIAYQFPALFGLVGYTIKIHIRLI